jgi:hypothetical protein
MVTIAVYDCPPVGIRTVGPRVNPSPHASLSQLAPGPLRSYWVTVTVRAAVGADEYDRPPPATITAAAVALRMVITARIRLRVMPGPFHDVGSTLRRRLTAAGSDGAAD